MLDQPAEVFPADALAYGIETAWRHGVLLNEDFDVALELWADGWRPVLAKNVPAGASAITTGTLFGIDTRSPGEGRMPLDRETVSQVRHGDAESVYFTLGSGDVVEDIGGLIVWIAADDVPSGYDLATALET